MSASSNPFLDNLAIYENNGGGTGAMHVIVDSQTAGENHIGEVSGRAVSISPTVTVDTVAYSAGDVVGGLLTLPNALRAANKSSILQSIVINDRADQKATLQIIIFNANPSAATLTNNAAVVFSTDDTKIIARIPVAGSDYVSLNSKATANIRNLNEIVIPASGTSLYAVIVTTGTPTYVATDNLSIQFKFQQN